jgi:four helix bundle protein
LKARAKRFAIQVVFLCRTLPRSDEGWVLGRQLLKAAASVAANYRAVCRSRSKAEFVAKIGIVVEEADETAFWLELLEECSVVAKEKLRSLLVEANELLAIFAASQRTARASSMIQ